MPPMIRTVAGWRPGCAHLAKRKPACHLRVDARLAAMLTAGQQETSTWSAVTSTFHLGQPRPNCPRNFELHPPWPFVPHDGHDAQPGAKDVSPTQGRILLQLPTGRDQRHESAEWIARHGGLPVVAICGRCLVPAFNQQEMDGFPGVLPLPRHLVGNDAALGEANHPIRT
jgi:hypothetical protein